MSTPEAPTSPTQQSPSRWRRFRSLLGLCIYWLVGYVLCFALTAYVVGHMILGRTYPISDHVLTAVLIFIGLRELWRRQRREAEAADESGVRSSGDAAAKV